MNDLSITTDLVDSRSDLTAEFAAFEAAGFKAVHWCHHWAGAPVFYDQEYVEPIAKLAAAHGLRIADIHGYSGPQSKLRYTDELFLAANINRLDFAAAVGAKVLVLHLPPRKDDPPSTRVDHSCGMIRRLLPECRRAGVLPAIENLGQPPEFHAAMLAAFGPAELGFCYDSGHANVHGHRGLVEQVAARVVAVHLHDNDGTADQHRLPGRGTCDWPRIIGALRSAGYAGTWNLEVFADKGMPLADFCKLAMERLRLTIGD